MMKSVWEWKRYFNLPFTIIGIVFLILFFQNCSTSPNIISKNLDSILSQSESISTTDKGGGDGSGFEGKISAYIRTLPNLSCRSPESVNNEHTYQWLGLSSGVNSNSLRTVHASTCSSHEEAFSKNDLEESNLQSQVVVYKNALFYEEGLTEKNSNQFAEAFCFDNSINTSSLQLVIRENYLASITEVKFWKKAKTDVLTNKFVSVDRIANALALNYSNEYFALTINTENTDLGKNTFSAILKLYDNEQTIVQKLTCKLGGEYDGRIWPAEMLDESKVLQFRKLKNNNVIYSTSDNKLYLKDQVTNKTSILLKDSNLQSIYHFSLTDQEDKLIFTGKNISSDIKNLYLLDLQTNQFRQLNGRLTTWQENVEDDFLLSPDSSFVIYRDGQQLLPGKYDLESKYLKSVSLQNYQVTQLHPNLGPDLEVNTFIPFGRDLVFFKIYNEFYINNYLGTNFKKVNLTNFGSAQNNILDIYYSDDGRLVSNLFSKDRVSSPWAAANSILNEFLMAPMFGTTFQTLKLQGEQISLLSDKAILYDVLSNEIYLGKNKYNKNVLAQDGQTIELTLPLTDYYFDHVNKRSYVIEIDLNKKQCHLAQFNSLTDKKVMLVSDLQNFMVMPRTFFDSVLFWQFKPATLSNDVAGFHLEMVDYQGNVKLIPNVFIKANHLKDFKILPGSKTAIVLASHVEEADYATLSDMKNVDWNFYQPKYDLYLISLDGGGVQRLSPMTDWPQAGVKAVWPMTEKEIYFSIGTTTQTHQIYLWKQKN